MISFNPPPLNTMTHRKTKHHYFAFNTEIPTERNKPERPSSISERGQSPGTLIRKSKNSIVK